MLGVVLNLSGGYYVWAYVVVLGTVLAASVVTSRQAVSQPERNEPPPRQTPFMLALRSVLIAFSALLAWRPLLLSPRSEHWLQLFTAVYATCAVGTVVLLALDSVERRHDSRALRVAVTVGDWSVCVLLLAALACVPVATRTPHNDVHYLTIQASRELLAGNNPYTSSYPDIFGGQLDLKQQIPSDVEGASRRMAYPYFPAALLIAAASLDMLGDLRYGHVLAIAIGAAIAWALARRRLGSRMHPLVLGVWLAFPTGPYVIESAWNDPVLIATFGLAMLATATGRLRSAAAALAVGACVKPYGLLASVPVGYAFLRSGNNWGALKLVAWTCVFGAAIALPFVVDDPAGFVARTLDPMGRATVHSWSLGLPSLLYNGFGVQLPKLVSTVLLIVVLIWLLLAFRAQPEPNLRWIATSFVGLLAAAVFFGWQSYCNQYYLVAALVHLHIVIDAPGFGSPTCAREVPLAHGPP